MVAASLVNSSSRECRQAVVGVPTGSNGGRLMTGGGAERKQWGVDDRWRFRQVAVGGDDRWQYQQEVVRG